jgi:hypothetical protein
MPDVNCKKNPRTTPVPPGLSLRDWFAGMAMQALIYRGLHSKEEGIQSSYRWADAMLVEREKHGK